MLDAFINNIQNNRYCEVNGLAIIFSNLLRGDYHTSFKIIDEFTPAAYPYSCVQDFMTVVSNHTNNLYNSLIADFTSPISVSP